MAAAAFITGYVAMLLLWLLLMPAGWQWLGSFFSLVTALVAARWAWQQDARASHSAGRSAVLGAVLLGAIGFVAGFFGPMLFAPQANQGPLLGLLITGPGGVVLGGVLGFVYGLLRAERD